MLDVSTIRGVGLLFALMKHIKSSFIKFKSPSTQKKSKKKTLIRFFGIKRFSLFVVPN